MKLIFYKILKLVGVWINKCTVLELFHEDTPRKHRGSLRDFPGFRVEKFFSTPIPSPDRSENPFLPGFSKQDCSVEQERTP